MSKDEVKTETEPVHSEQGEEIVLRIDPEIQSLLKGLSDEQTYEALKEKIKREGFRPEYRVIVAGSPEEYRGVIVAGEQRYRVCQALGIDFPYELRDYADREALIEDARAKNN